MQKGNAPEERKLQRLFRNAEASRLIKRCNDFGAGGVSVAIGELADGLDIDLNAVPKKYEGLDGTELAISESQERMAVVVAAGGRRPLHGRWPTRRTSRLPSWLRVTGKSRAGHDTGTAAPSWISARDFLNSNGAAKHIDAPSPNSLQSSRRDQVRTSRRAICDLAGRPERLLPAAACPSASTPPSARAPCSCPSAARTSSPPPRPWLHEDLRRRQQDTRHLLR